MKRYSTLGLIVAVLASLSAFSADNIIVPANEGKAYLKDSGGKLFPASVVYTTDGNGNITPIASSISNITIGTVNQGTNNDGSAPWHVIDDAWLSDFNAWKAWADVNLSTRASESTLSSLNGKFGSLGQKAMAGSAPVVLASDQAAIPVNSTSVGNTTVVQPTGTNLHAVVDSGMVTANIGTAGGLALDSTVSSINGKLGSLGQKAMAGSAPVVIASDQSAVSVNVANTPTVTANAGTGNFTVVQSTGTNLHSVVDSGSITANIGTTNGLALDATVSGVQATNGSAIASKSDLIAGKDGSGNQRPLSVDSSGNLNIQGGNSTAVKVDGSAVTQPVSGTVNAAQVGNYNVRLDDGNGNVVTSQLSGSQRALDVGVNVAGVQVDPRSIRALTSSDVVTAAQGTAAAASGAWPIKATDGTNVAAVKAASTAALATDPAIVVAVSPNNTPVLPSGAATSANQTGGGQKSQVVDGANATVGPVTTISGVNYLPVVQSSSVAPGSAVPARATLVAGSDGTNAQSLSTDTSGHLQVVGSVASGSSDAGNPEKIGGIYESSQTSVSTGQRVNAHATAFGDLTTGDNTKFVNITTATTTTVKSGAGLLYAICFNKQVNNATDTIYDNTAGSGTKIGTITEVLGGGASAPSGCSRYNGVAFSTGLTIVTSGASDLTVLYK